MAKLSAREQAAKKAGVAVNYSKSATQQVKPMSSFKPVVPKVVAKQTPTNKLMTAQKSQPISGYQPLPKGMYGPAAPKKVIYDNAKASYDKVLGNIKSAIDIQNQVNSVKSSKSFRDASLKIESDRANKEAKDAKEASKPVNVVKGLAKSAKEMLISNRGYSDEEVKKAKPTFKETVKAGGKYVGEMGQGLVKIGGFAAQGLANKFGSEDYANKVRQAREKFGQATDKYVAPSTAGEAKVMKFGDISTIGLGALRTGAISKNVGRIVTRAGEAGVSPKGINRIISEGAKGTFNPLKTNVARAAEAFPEGGVLNSIDNFAPEARVLGDSINVPKVAENAPRRTVAPTREIQPTIKDIPEGPRRVARTREEIPRGNQGRADELYTEADPVTKKEKVYANVNDGGQDLKQVEVGEYDEAGNFVEKMAEDGRPISTVLDESATNLRAGKRGVTKLDAASGSRPVASFRGFGSGKGRGKGGLLSEARSSTIAKQKVADRLKQVDASKADAEEYGFLQGVIEKKGNLNEDEMTRVAQFLDKQHIKGSNALKSQEAEKHWINLGRRAKSYDEFKRAFPQGTDEQAMKDLFIKSKSRSFNSPVVGQTAPAKGLFGMPRTLKGSVKNPFYKDPLLQEAGKYKSAEAFVKAQGKPVYHGTDRAFNEFNPAKTEGDFGRGIYFTNDFKEAKGYAELSGKGKPRVIEGYVNLKNPYKTDNYTWKNKTFKDGFPKDTQAELKKRGYDGVIFTGADGKYQEIVAFDPSQIKTKSQLTDLYNKAQGGKKSIFNKSLPGFVKNPFVKESVGGFDTQAYVREMARKQRQAEGKGAFMGKVKSFLSEFKKKIVDTNSPIEDLISEQQKKLGFESRPRYDMTNQIDRVYRSTSMAGDFARKNGLEDVIRNVDNIDEFDQYLIAKHGQSLEADGIQTGRDAVKDRMFLEAIGDKYAKEEKVVRDYSHKLLDYAVESGLVSKKVAADLKVKYPDYVPYQRIFGEDEAVARGTGGGVASLGKQSVVQRIKGSEREVQSPMQSFLEKTTSAFQQGEKNKAAQILTQYDKLPDNPFGLEKVVGTKSPGDNTISVFKDGVKEMWKVNKEIADAAKALNVEQIGILGKIFVAPVRIAKLGITGINLPFVFANVSRDIVSAFVNSKNSFRSLIAMPEAIFQALGHGKLYKEMLSEGAMQTSFDIARNQIAPTIRDTRGLLGNKGMEKVKYIASTPGKLFRAVEDIIGRSEELNRISQYKGAYKGAIAKGMTPIDARAVAARAARENSVNFARKGEYGSAMNALVLYLNAGVQGSRTLLRSIKTRPVATSAKIVTTVGMPLAITTSWNLSDPKRREAYEDIPEFEKENNFIFIPNNPTKDENGKWDVVKIPIQPGLSNMVQPIRYALERMSGLDPQTFAQMASQLSGAVSPVQFPTDAETGRKTISQLTPQAIKPSMEAYNNKDFFTGAPIIPRKLEGLSPELQVKDNTSGTSKILGAQLGASPLQVEHFIKSTFGSVGLQFLNASDRTLAATGKISPEDIGGQDIMSAVTARFNKAAGGAVENALWDKQAKAKEADKSMKYEKKQEFMPLYNQIQELKNSNPEEAQKAVENMSDEQYEQYKSVRKSERAKSSSQFHDLLNADPKQAVKYVRSLPEDEAQRLVDNMTDEQYAIYETGK